jgi:2,3-bisphosphoglycerate-independent phosphoglycerate mutase
MRDVAMNREITNTKRPKPFLLLILDGFGIRKEASFNAIAQANTPNLNALIQRVPMMLLDGSGHAVGLPDGQMGNSEVGHTNIGAGRVVFQDLTRVDDAINNGEFNSNPVLNDVIATVTHSHARIHIFGLLSPGGVHSHEQHIFTLCDLLADKNINYIVHPFLDGRDTPPKSAQNSLQQLQNHIARTPYGHIGSVTGRYYAMDRDNRWDRVQKTYDMLTLGTTPFHEPNALSALNAAYARGETDEFMIPTLITQADHCDPLIRDNDAIIFMNFRADRARQLSAAFVKPDFDQFQRTKVCQLAQFISLTEYDDQLPIKPMFPPIALHNTLGEYLADHAFKQLRIAETEKYAHVTFFFNGGREQPYPGEDRILVPSPLVATYDLKPEMSAHELTDQLVASIQGAQYDFIVANYANPDMVGHSGDFAATVTAVEVIDVCLGRIIKALQECGGELLLTADHGNAELMHDEVTHQPHTAHTSSLVPLVYMGRPATFIAKSGVLADIAPTTLYLLGLPVPSDMTGQVLIQLNHSLI